MRDWPLKDWVLLVSSVFSILVGLGFLIDALCPT